MCQKLWLKLHLNILILTVHMWYRNQNFIWCNDERETKAKKTQSSALLAAASVSILPQTVIVFLSKGGKCFFPLLLLLVTFFCVYHYITVLCAPLHNGISVLLNVSSLDSDLLLVLITFPNLVYSPVTLIWHCKKCPILWVKGHKFRTP